MAVEKQRHAHSSQQVTHKTQMRQSCFACFFYFPFKIRSLSAQRFFKAKHPTHCQAGQYLDRSKRGSHLSIARKDAPGPVLPPQIVPQASPRLVSVYKALQKSGHAPRLSCRCYHVHIRRLLRLIPHGCREHLCTLHVGGHGVPARLQLVSQIDAA
jgi:hypothetical protein